MMNRDQKDFYMYGLGSIDWGQTVKDALTLAPTIAQTVQLFRPVQQQAQPTVVDNSAQLVSAFQQQQDALKQQLAQQNAQFQQSQAALQMQLAQERDAQARATEAVLAKASAKTSEGGDKTLMYVGAGVGAVAVIGLVAFLATKK